LTVSIPDTLAIPLRAGSLLQGFEESNQGGAVGGGKAQAKIVAGDGAGRDAVAFEPGGRVIIAQAAPSN
jgi:hypothetical protein